jgi:nucleoside-diphosphate-sugar epimerase
MHVDDTCKAIKTVLDKGKLNEIYNISNNEPVVFRDAIDYIVKKFNSNSVIENIEPPEFHKKVQVKDMYLNSQKLFDLGYIPSYNIFQGLDEIYG